VEELRDEEEAQGIPEMETPYPRPLPLNLDSSFAISFLGLCPENVPPRKLIASRLALCLLGLGMVFADYMYSRAIGSVLLVAGFGSLIFEYFVQKNTSLPEYEALAGTDSLREELLMLEYPRIFVNIYTTGKPSRSLWPTAERNGKVGGEGVLVRFSQGFWNHLSERQKLALIVYSIERENASESPWMFVTMVAGMVNFWGTSLPSGIRQVSNAALCIGMLGLILNEIMKRRHAKKVLATHNLTREFDDAHQLSRHLRKLLPWYQRPWT
jgi:hypothetical protein